MTLDTQLILEAMSELFDKIDARWAQRDAAREASRGIPVPTQSAAVGADAVADNRGDLFDRGEDSDEQRRDEPIIADNWGGIFDHFQEEQNLDVPACVAAAPESCLTSTDPDAPACVAPAPESCLTSTDPDALAWIAPVPAVLICAAPTSTPNNSPSRCSMQVHTSETMVMTLPASAFYPSHISKDNSEYISISSSASMCGIVLLHLATKALEGSEVLVRMNCQCLVMPRLLSASVLDIGPWPLPLKNKNTILSDTIKLYFSLELSFSYGQDIVQQRSPWPPPTQWDMETVSGELRPIPWPSFAYRTVALQLGNFLIFHGLHLYFKLMVSQHTLQDILVIYAPGFQSWLTSFTLGIHSDISDMLLLNSVFISWIDVYWLLLHYHHEPVKWKLPCVYLLCVNVISYCVASSIGNWKPTVGVIQLSQLAVLVDFGCYQLQRTRIRAFSPWNFWCLAAFFVHFIIDGCNLLLLIVWKSRTGELDDLAFSCPSPPKVQTTCPGAELRAIPWPSFGFYQCDPMLLLQLPPPARQSFSYVPVEIVEPLQQILDISVRSSHSEMFIHVVSISMLANGSTNYSYGEFYRQKLIIHNWKPFCLNCYQLYSRSKNMCFAVNKDVPSASHWLISERNLVAQYAVWPVTHNAQVLLIVMTNNTRHINQFLLLRNRGDHIRGLSVRFMFLCDDILHKVLSLVLALLITKNLQFSWDPGGAEFPTEIQVIDVMLCIRIYFLEVCTFVARIQWSKLMQDHLKGSVVTYYFSNSPFCYLAAFSGPSQREEMCCTLWQASTMAETNCQSSTMASIRFYQAAWDPDGFHTMNRLGGKPNLKQGRMLALLCLSLIRKLKKSLHLHVMGRRSKFGPGSQTQESPAQSGPMCLHARLRAASPCKLLYTVESRGERSYHRLSIIM